VTASASQTRDRGHGRRETGTVKAVTVTTPGGIGFPQARQAVQITRTRTITNSGKTTREAAYLTISLPAAHAHPIDLQDWIRREWLIEALHHVRDVTSVKTHTRPGPAKQQPENAMTLACLPPSDRQRTESQVKPP
jgi:hypothetical protein